MEPMGLSVWGFRASACGLSLGESLFWCFEHVLDASKTTVATDLRSTRERHTDIALHNCGGRMTEQRSA